MGKTRPPHCSDKCPFWEKCTPEVDRAERGLRVAEHALTACSCLVTTQLALTLWGKRLRQAAEIPARLRGVANLTLGAGHWAEFAHSDKGSPTVGDGIEHLVHVLVPLAVLAQWGLKPLSTHAIRLKHLGGCCLVAGGLWSVYQVIDRRDEAGHRVVVTEAINDLLETPAENWLPEVAQAAIGIGSGLWWLYNDATDE